jgi:hypothetical protein
LPQSPAPRSLKEEKAMNTRQTRATLVARATGLAVLGLAFFSLAGQIGEGTLTVDIRGHASGRVTPAMICITSLRDNTWRTPPDGRVAPPYTRVPDFMDPKEWKPGDIGPVRLTGRGLAR